MTTKDQIDKAERLVALVLAQLERETGGYVTGLDVTDFDTTTLKDERPQMKRSVSIDIKPKPGSNWSV